MRKSLYWLTAVAATIPSIAMAHTGAMESNSFVSGLLHPLTGLDHLLALLAVGIWAAQRQTSDHRATWLYPLAYVLALMVGSALGSLFGMGAMVEFGITFSVLAIGAMITFSLPLSATLAVSVIAGFALLHGVAHGAEMPVSAGSAYLFGVATLSAAIAFSGVGVGRLMRKAQMVSMRAAGAVLASAGAYLTLS